MVSTQQLNSQVEGDLLLVTLIDAAGENAVSSKSLSQTLMIQALNPSSSLRTRRLGAPVLGAPSAAPSSPDQPKGELQPRFTERDIAAFALAKLARDQQQICERMGQEIKALQSATVPVRLHQSSTSPHEKPQFAVDGMPMDSKLDALRQTTLRQTKERNAVISKLEDVLVSSISEVRYKTCCSYLSCKNFAYAIEIQVLTCQPCRRMHEAAPELDKAYSTK
jgi:hypothetical protein